MRLTPFLVVQPGRSGLYHRIASGGIAKTASVGTATKRDGDRLA